MSKIQRYSGFQLLRQALAGNTGWQRAWRDPEPKREYDVIIIGGGGHGLATAYYLAKEHGISNIAVLEKGYLGGGNTGRNTTLIRSNYMLDGNTQFFDLSMKLWQNLSTELNYNCMVSHRGQYVLSHAPGQFDAARRRANVMLMNGIEARLYDREALKERVPYLDYSENARFPIHGAIFQPLAGSVRHDAVAWGYARAADALGVDILQQCEVQDFLFEAGRVTGVRTNRGEIRAPKVAMAVAGHTTELARKAGLRLPIESLCLTAYVSEPLKPLLDSVITFGAGHLYISQSNKGGLVFGGELDAYNSYAQRGNLPVVEDVMSCAMAMLPNLPKIRMLRSWGGIQDMTMDGSPIIGKTPVDGLYLNGGWCYQGFKATPASGFCFAHTLARDEIHPLIAPYALDRFERGRVLEELPTGPMPNLH